MTIDVEPQAPARFAGDGPPGELTVLTADQCVRLLGRHHLGRLAFAVGEEVSIFPVNYVFDGTSVVVRTSPGAKLDRAPMRQATFEIDEADPGGSWGWSVVVEGPCFDVTSPLDERSEALRKLPVEPFAPGDRHYWLQVGARRITGRAFGLPPE